MLAYFLRKFFHRRREDVLIHFFDHVGGAMPHEFRDILLRNAYQQALAGVVVSQCVEVEILVDDLLTASAELIPVVADIDRTAGAYSAADRMADKVLADLGGYRHLTVGRERLRSLDLLRVVLIEDCGFAHLYAVREDVLDPQSRDLGSAQTAFRSKKHGYLVDGPGC